MADERQSILAQLRFPLVFFGLALIVVEAAIGTALNTTQDPETVTLLINWMGGLLIYVVTVVAFLVYKTPSHIMLGKQDAVSPANNAQEEQEQEHQRNMEELKVLRKQYNTSLKLLKDAHAKEIEKLTNKPLGEEED